MTARRHARRVAAPAGLAATTGWSAFAVIAASGTLIAMGDAAVAAVWVLVVGLIVVGVGHALIRIGAVPFPASPGSISSPDALGSPRDTNAVREQQIDRE